MTRKVNAAVGLGLIGGIFFTILFWYISLCCAMIHDNPNGLQLLGAALFILGWTFIGLSGVIAAIMEESRRRAIILLSTGVSSPILQFASVFLIAQGAGLSSIFITEIAVLGVFIGFIGVFAVPRLIVKRSK